MNIYLLKLDKTCHVKQSHHTRIKKEDIFNHIWYVYSDLICQKTNNWTFSPMGKIRRKVQQYKSCHNVCFWVLS